MLAIALSTVTAWHQFWRVSDGIQAVLLDFAPDESFYMTIAFANTGNRNALIRDVALIRLGPDWPRYDDFSIFSTTWLGRPRSGVVLLKPSDVALVTLTSSELQGPINYPVGIAAAVVNGEGTPHYSIMHLLTPKRLHLEGHYQPIDIFARPSSEQVRAVLNRVRHLDSL